MKWKKFTIQTTTAAEDFISEKLSEIGIEGIEIEDKVELTANDTKGMFIDVLPDLGPDFILMIRMMCQRHLLP